MKQINVNVVGTPTDTPTLTVDGRTDIYRADLSEPGRAIFRLLDREPTGNGASILYAGKTVRVIVPPVGTWEADQRPVKPPDATEPVVLVYAPPAPRIAIDGVHFTSDGARWTWRGCTDFRLPHRFITGEDITAVLEDRKAIGANLVRCLAMKANNIGWELIPARQPDYWAGVRRFFDLLGARGFACEWTVFADTKITMPDASAQVDFWRRTIELARDYPFVVLELVNEAGHPTQAIDPQRFERPAGVPTSHGSGGTDEDVVRPVWDYAAYHARRAQHRGDARGASNYSPYAYQEDYPKPCPFVPDEGDKPASYGFDPEFARLMGRHASCGAGGTFHSDDGIQSVVFSLETRTCAAAFFDGLS
jgi:hypothetical protein